MHEVVFKLHNNLYQMNHICCHILPWSNAAALSKGPAFGLHIEVFHVLFSAADSNRGLIHFRCHHLSLHIYLFSGFLYLFRLFIKDALGDMLLGEELLQQSTSRTALASCTPPHSQRTQREVVLTPILFICQERTQSCTHYGVMNYFLRESKGGPVALYVKKYAHSFRLLSPSARNLTHHSWVLAG